VELGETRNQQSSQRQQETPSKNYQSRETTAATTKMKTTKVNANAVDILGSIVSVKLA